MSLHSPSFFSSNWCDRQWTSWAPLDPSFGALITLPRGGGIYRIRPIGEERLAYIGQSSRLYDRLRKDLAPHVYGDAPPWNDPHTAAPALWAYRREHDYVYECSVTEVERGKAERCGLEDALIWRYRIERGESPLCNHGRFPAAWIRPSNRKARRAMVQRQATEATEILWSHPPLEMQGRPGSAYWMGLDWAESQRLSEVCALPADAALYCIIDPDSGEVLYIGQSTSLRARASSHSRRDWSTSAPYIRFCLLPSKVSPQHLLELESDLLGAFFYQVGHPPAFQYGGA